MTGSGSGRKLHVASLGGANQNFDTQCSPGSYAAIPNVGTQPYCQPAPDSRSPLVSTVLYTLDYKGKDGAGAAGLAAAAASLVVAAAAMALAY